MLAGLGAVVAQLVDVVKAHHVAVLLGGVLLLGPLFDFGVQVVAVLVLDGQQPRHVVDAGDKLLAALQLVLHAQAFQQVLGAGLHAVAQAHGLHAGVALHVAGEHGHGVGVVEEQRVGADLFHIPGKVLQHGDGPQGPHNAANAQGVGNGLAQAVLLGDFKVDDSAGLVETHLDGVHHKLGAPQGLLAVFYAQIGFQHSPALVDILVDGGQNAVALVQPLAVNVIQGNFAFPQGGGAHHVAQHVAGKHRAAGAHKSNFQHFLYSLLGKDWLRFQCTRSRRKKPLQNGGQIW